MKTRRIAKMAAVVVITTFLVAIIILNLKGVTVGELKVFEAIELFVAIPLLTVIYYWLIATKFDEFHSKLTDFEGHFKRISSKLESEEKRFTVEEKTMREEERNLRMEITALQKEDKTLTREIKEMKRLVVGLDKRIKRLKK